MNSLKVKQVLSSTCNKKKVQFIQNTLPSKQRVWLPSRHTQMSKHCSSRLRNKMNFRSRSCVWMDDMHCRDSSSLQSPYAIQLWTQRVFYGIGGTYLWGENTQVGYDSWHWHDVKKEGSQQIVWEVSSNDRPEKYQIKFKWWHENSENFNPKTKYIREVSVVNLKTSP